MHTSITRMEESIGRDMQEIKAKLSACEQVLVPQFIKKFENWDAKFKQHHTILNLFFNWGTLTTNREPAAVPVVGLRGC